MEPFRKKNGFTLIELILIIVIVSILIGIAVRGYVNLKRNASDGAAKGVLGVLRSQNTLMYSQYVVRGSTASYTMRAIANNMSTGLMGISWTAAATRFTMTVGGNTYTFTLSPTPRPPTTYGRVIAGAGTFASW